MGFKFPYAVHCRVVTYKTGKTLADSWKAAFFESSAKENSSVQEIFQSLIREIENHDQDGNVDKKDDCNILWQLYTAAIDT